MTWRTVRATSLTKAAAAAGVVVIACTTGFLLARFPDLPDILPVHFRRDGHANGWQYKTYARVLMPVFVQLALAGTLGAVGALLLSRPRGDDDQDTPDVRTAAAAAEAVALIAVVWVVFQAYAAYALVELWQRGRDGLGPFYTVLEITGVVLSVVVFARAQHRFGRPAPLPFVAEHWVLGQLYRNRFDPALFVPTRDGSRWTLNFGRPVAAALMALVLGVGVVGPAIILGLLLR
jgi:uncharacterized membrane protein